MPQDERVTHADVIIENASGIYELESSVAETWNSRVSRANRRIEGDR